MWEKHTKNKIANDFLSKQLTTSYKLDLKLSSRNNNTLQKSTNKVYFLLMSSIKVSNLLSHNPVGIYWSLLSIAHFHIILIQDIDNEKVFCVW